jgi:DNA repair protein RadC
MKEIFELRESDFIKTSVTTPRALFAQTKKIHIDHDQECVIVFYLDSRHNVKQAEVLFKGGLDRTLIDTKTLFRRAIEQKVPLIALAHNHPSGNLSPSDADIQVSHGIANAGDLLGIDLVDHIIFNRTEFYSMKEGNLL